MVSAARNIMLLCAVLVAIVSAQTKDAYSGRDVEGKGLLDPSRFTVHHAATFGMSSSSNVSGLQSQSLYMTMLQYKFSSPVTLNLDFGIPVHSTYNDAQNLTKENFESAEYFKNMPFNASLTWQPRENFLMSLTVARESYGSSQLLYDSPFRFDRAGTFDARK